MGLLLFQIEYKHARRLVQLFIGLYMVVYLGLICNENMQIEGFWYYLFTGVFEAATHTLCGCKNIWSSDLWKRLVWLCLLDCYGSGFSAI